MKLILLSKGILTVLSVVSQAVQLVVSTTENHEHVTPTPHLLVERDQVIIGGTFLGYYSTIDLGTTSWLSATCPTGYSFTTSSTFWACCSGGVDCGVAAWFTSCSGDVDIAGTQSILSQCTSPYSCATMPLYKSLGDPYPLLDVHCDSYVLTLYEQIPGGSPPSTTSSLSGSATTFSSSSITRASSTSSTSMSWQSSSTLAVTTGPQNGTNPGSSSSGLSTSGIIGIAVAVTLLGLIAAGLVLGILVHRQRQRRKVKDKAADEPGTHEPASPHEMFTKSNTAELLGREKYGVGSPVIATEDRTEPAEVLAKEKLAYSENERLIAEKKDVLSQVPPVPLKVPIPPRKDLNHSVTPAAYELSQEAISNQQELDAQLSAVPKTHELESDLAALHEMDPQSRAELEEVLPEWVTRVGLEAQRAIEIGGSEAEAAPSPSSTRHSISRKPIASPYPGSPGPSNTIEKVSDSAGDEETDEQGEARLKVLRERIGRIRADKERLLEIQRLAQLEEETKVEILTEQRRLMGK